MDNECNPGVFPCDSGADSYASSLSSTDELLEVVRLDGSEGSAASGSRTFLLRSTKYKGRNSVDDLNSVEVGRLVRTRPVVLGEDGSSLDGKAIGGSLGRPGD